MSEKALVMGLGVSGAAAATYLQSQGVNVIIADDATTGSVRRRAEEFIQQGIQVELGTAKPDQLLTGIDFVVASPGVPPRHPLLLAARAQQKRLFSEVELGYQACNARVIAVTGTNGKSTVTTLCGQIFEAAGIPTAVCGNIGTPMIQVAPDVPADGLVVVEVSSFQLSLTESFHARAGVILNVAPDHLDWHKDFEEYAQAKARVWQHQTSDDLSLANGEDEMTVALLRNAGGRQATFQTTGLPESGVGVIDGSLVAVNVGSLDQVELLPLTLLKNPSNLDIANFAAAAAIASDLEVAPDLITTGISDFEPLPHRRQLVAEVDGIRFIDDSKATNPHAALAAIRAYRAVILIAGGLNKGLDLNVLADAQEHLRAIITIGTAADEVAAAFAHTDLPVVHAESLKAAVAIAHDIAVIGDVVLLSPACASFDAFKNYKERGKSFARAAHDLVATGGGHGI